MRKKRGGAGLELRSASSCEAKRREFKFDIFRVQVSAAQICKFDFKFERKRVKAKYFEMIFGVLKLKFDEDKACSLSSQILTKSTKSTQKISRKLFKI